MSSEILGGAENVLKGNLGGAWDIKHGYADAYTDLGVARRFGGAAAAYSLRDIGAMNGEVVRVRREPYDSTEAIDDEAKFSANQVSSGALEDWVNGKLEDTLPADVAPAAAAYSLRKVSEGKLVYTGDFSSDADTIGANTTGITVTGNNDGIFTKDDVLKVENDERGVPQLATSNSDYESSTSGVVEFEYYVPSTHPIVGNFWHIGTNTTADGKEIAYSARGVKIVGGAWTTAKLFYGSLYGGVDKATTQGTGGRRLITILDQEVADGAANSTTVAGEDGDVYYISSLTIKTYDAVAVQIRRSSDNAEVKVHFDSNGVISNSSRVTNAEEETVPFIQIDNNDTTLAEFLNPSGSGTDAFVVIWYDQAGLKKAEQISAASQPQIASSGALLADGIEFDGSTLTSSSALGATSTIGIFAVIKPDSADADGYILDNRDANDDGARLMQSDAGIGKYLFSMDSTDISLADEGVSTTETLVTAIQSSTAATLFKNAVQIATAANDEISVTSGYRIGGNMVGTGTHFDGTMKELILFTSDQTDNRFKIESNINNYYGLYNDANELVSDFAKSGSATISNASKDGFTGETTDGNDAYFGVELNEKVASSDIVYISFNSTKASSSGDGVGLRKTSIGGTLAQSSITSFAAGFNSIALVTDDVGGFSTTTFSPVCESV